MCIEHFRYLMFRHKTIRCPLESSEDGVFPHFFSVDLSHRKAVLLRGGPLWKGLGGIITYTSVPFAPPFLWLFGASSVYPSLCKNEGLLVLFVLWHAVVLPMGAVVSQRLTVVPARDAVVPQALAVVPLHGRGSTVASGRAQQHERKSGRM